MQKNSAKIRKIYARKSALCTQPKCVLHEMFSDIDEQISIKNQFFNYYRRLIIEIAESLLYYESVIIFKF